MGNFVLRRADPRETGQPRSTASFYVPPARQSVILRVVAGKSGVISAELLPVLTGGADGQPRFATGVAAMEIVQRIRGISEQFATTVVQDGDVGRIRPTAG